MQHNYKNPNYQKDYYKKNRKKILAYYKTYRLKHQQKMNEACRRSRLKLKMKLFKLLGGKCIRCNISDIRVLQIDHIKGGGTKKIKKLHANRYNHYLKKIESGSKEYQLLCANCNWIKRYENNE